MPSRGRPTPLIPTTTIDPPFATYQAERAHAESRRLVDYFCYLTGAANNKLIPMVLARRSVNMRELCADILPELIAADRAAIELCVLEIRMKDLEILSRIAGCVCALGALMSCIKLSNVGCYRHSL